MRRVLVYVKQEMKQHEQDMNQDMNEWIINT